MKAGKSNFVIVHMITLDWLNSLNFITQRQQLKIAGLWPCHVWKLVILYTLLSYISDKQTNIF